MAQSYERNVGGQEIGFGLVSKTNGGPVTNVTPTAYRVLDGGAQVVAEGAVTEEGHGQFIFTPSAADINAAQACYLFRATGGMSDSVNILTGAGIFRRATAGQHLGFNLISVTDGSDLLSATVTVYLAIDGQAQGVATGTVTEKGLGQYDFSPSVADIDGDKISYLFTATGAVLRNRTIATVATETAAVGATGRPVRDILAALVAFVRSQGAVTALLGSPGQCRFYPEYIPENIPDRPAATYTRTDDSPVGTLSAPAGFRTARVRIEIWGEGGNRGPERVNDVYLALWGVLDGYRGAMGTGTVRVFVQKAGCENGAMASPAPAEGASKTDAQASFDCVLNFDDLPPR